MGRHPVSAHATDAWRQCAANGFAHGINGLEPGKRDAPGQQHTPEWRGIDKVAIFDQRLILWPGFGCRTGDDRDSRTAGYHVPHGFQRTALQRAAHAAGFGKFRARLYDLIAKTVTLSEQKQVFGGNGFRREAFVWPAGGRKVARHKMARRKAGWQRCPAR